MLVSKVVQSPNGEFSCTECGFVTKFKNSCINHIEAKHGTNTYECVICQKVMTSRAALNNHNHRYHRTLL